MTTNELCPNGIFANEKSCCVLILPSKYGDDGSATSWCVRGAHDETSPHFGLTWDRWAERVDAEHIGMYFGDVPYLGKVTEEGIEWKESSVDVLPETDSTTSEPFMWRRFHIAPHQFAVLRRPHHFFFSSMILRMFLDVFVFLLSVPNQVISFTRLHLAQARGQADREKAP